MSNIVKDFDPQGIVGETISYNRYAGKVVVPAHFSKPKVLVPMRAKELATKYLASNRQMAVIGEIWESGLAIEVGIVIKLRDGGKLNDYINMMYQEEWYRTQEKVKDGDGGIALT